MLGTCCRHFLLVQVIPLHKGYLVQPEQYPRLTLLGQALGAVRLGYEALSHIVPEVTDATAHGQGDIPVQCTAKEQMAMLSSSAWKPLS